MNWVLITLMSCGFSESSPNVEGEGSILLVVSRQMQQNKIFMRWYIYFKQILLRLLLYETVFHLI